MADTRICMVGAAGKMGRRIMALINDTDGAVVGAAAEYAESPHVGDDAGVLAGIGETGVKVVPSITDAAADTDVYIDFTGSEPTMNNLESYRKAGKPVVIGSTGFTSEQKDALMDLAKDIPVLFSPNMSMGVNLTFKILEMVAGVIGDMYDIEIVESHHRMKKDAPSGTAMRMAEVIADTLKRDLEKDAVYCRRGLIGERTDKEIGIQTLRAGDIVGEHTVMFCGPGERIEITHRAHTRDNFAKGAILGATWMAGKPAGFYSMYDVLGL